MNIEEIKRVQLGIAEDIFNLTKNKINILIFYGTLLGAVRHKGFIPWDDDIDLIVLRKDLPELLKIMNLNNLCFTSYLDKINPLPFIKVFDNSSLVKEDYKFKMNIGISIDIFILDNIPRNNWKRLQIRILKEILLKLFLPYNKNKPLFKRLILKLLNKLPMFFNYKIIKRLENLAKSKDEKVLGNILWVDGWKRNIFLKEDLVPPVNIEFEGKFFPAPKNYHKVLANLYGRDFMQLPPISERVTGHNKVTIKKEN